MNSRQRAALKDFARAVNTLREAGVIRSHRYLGDIAEFLCAGMFGIDLATNLRQAGHDGLRGEVRAQVKYGGGKKTNVDLGNPDAYDEIYVVLGQESVVRAPAYEGDFLVYILTADEARALKTPGGSYSCGASYFEREPHRVIWIETYAN
ncbi:hypothetical protein [Myxococcus landrumensis]|uniref:PD(D/E)XK endonuclease domain-containing protein n=1 Tax=Myxococcus landrumensis TaxID=2813577 RepID=A0ABX7NHJ2_9BACT|nr:hypothetical protein [Myxococcus landrumus]QSQ16846.1 hypothetical protein JY572_12680 [Myxococcus landrumus]